MGIRKNNSWKQMCNNLSFTIKFKQLPGYDWQTYIKNKDMVEYCFKLF